MRELTLEHLAPYFPYQLKVIDDDENIATVCSLHTECCNVNYDANVGDYELSFDEVKPILLPLSALYHTEGFSMSDMISHGYHNTFWGKDKFSVKHIYYHDLLILLKHHFDVFKLIDDGLAIDLNTIIHE